MPSKIYDTTLCNLCARDSFPNFRGIPVFARIAQILLNVQNVVDLLEVCSLIVQASHFGPLSLKSSKDMSLGRLNELLQLHKCLISLLPAFLPICHLSSCTLLFINFALPVGPALTLISIRAAIPDLYSREQMLFWRAMLVSGKGTCW